MTSIMQTHSIAVIAGDGVGREIMPEALDVLRHLGKKHQIGFAFH